MDLRDLERLLKEQPELNDFGFGVFDNQLRGAARQAEIALNRERLIDGAEKIFEVVGWLEAYIAPIKSLNQSRTSYGMKHVVERDKSIGYITNGQFIAAALLGGFDYQLPYATCPNAHFNMSEKSWKEADRRFR